MDKHPPESSNPETFVPPRHWVMPEELTASYWNDPKVQEKRGQEFLEKPIEAIALIDKTDKAGLARRDFLTIMGASIAMSTVACARRPVHKIIPYVVKPEEITPGVADWYASTCQGCSTGCGILVKNREGRPIKIEGNPENPISQGALCVRGQAGVLSLYDPDRLQAPVAFSRQDGSRREVAWADADADVVKHLKGAMGAGGRVRILTETLHSPSELRLIKEFLGPFRAGAHVQYDPLALSEISDAQQASYGTALIPRYRFDEAELILSLGADFMGTWLSPVEHAAAWSKGRKLESLDHGQARLTKLICFEPTLSITGASADERYPIRPGDELKIALALAHVLIVEQKRSSHAGQAEVTAALETYKPEAVASEIGLAEGATQIRRIAQELWEKRGKGLVVAGGIHSRTATAVQLQIAANLLNSALENEGATVDGSSAYGAPLESYAGIAKLIAEMNAGQVEVLIIHRANPAYTLPQNVSGFSEAMKKVPFVVVIAEHANETASLADYALPDHHYLENWGDANPRKGLYSLQQPTIAPLFSSRAFEDSLIAWTKSTGLSSGMAAHAADWHEYIQTNWKESLYREFGIAGSFEQFWEGSLRDGVFDGSAAKGANARPTARAFRAASLKDMPKYSAMVSGGDGAWLSLYAKGAMHDGKGANNPWLQELPEPASSVTWDNQLNVSPAMAKRLNLNNDDVVEVSLGHVRAELPVFVQPGMHSEVVSAAVGYGRRSVGKVGNLAGVDVYPLTQVVSGQLAFSGQAVKVRKTGRFYKLATTQWHMVTENRPIINDIPLAKYRKNPSAANETDPELRLETVPSMWPVHEYKGYRWGMAVDLNSCTGCGACVVACYAENNVPVVGREQVRNSRHMQWLRIDRYYSGTLENPNVVFQPMLCQHCENAPCETVCPVLATVHDDEGLNVQIYNRCVGTRYCQNNCPYKVRRFNFFDHWKSYDGTMNLAWNPDVTVRSRGIMEKCTFCVQRIREAKDHAKDLGEKVKDGAFKTACQQTCPTDALVFGDINDPESRVSKLREHPRAYRVIENLNTKPSISYLTKVRNSENA